MLRCWNAGMLEGGIPPSPRAKNPLCLPLKNPQGKKSGLLNFGTEAAKSCVGICSIGQKVSKKYPKGIQKSQEVRFTKKSERS